jgi:RsiW-degrading membrane proteinase PrsW (M82 family)
MVIYPIFLYWMDRYEKEPIVLLSAVFIWGFIPAAIFSLISQLIFDIPLYLMDFEAAAVDLVTSAVVAPITEEVFKGMAVLAVFLLWRREFDGVFDGIIYGSLVGFGFAAIENVLYFLEADTSLVILRAFVFGLNHALFTSFTGIGFGIARHSPNPIVRFAAPVIGLLAAIAAHAIHNGTVSLVEMTPVLLCVTFLADWGGVAFVFVVMILALRRERMWIVEHLQGEVAGNTLSQSQYEVSASALRRFSALVGALVSGGFGRWWRVGRYLDTLTDLAYKKHAHSRRGEHGASSALINDLRTRAAALSMEVGDLTVS